MAKYKPKKHRGVAMVLAVLFAQFTWVYTWKYNYWKFLLAFTVNIIFMGTIFVPVITWIIAIIDVFKTPQELFDDYY